MSPLPAIGIITALAEEFTAVKTIMCHCREDPKRGRRYQVGEIPSVHGGGNHCVVLALMSDTGNNSAAIRATTMLNDYKSVDDIVMVGIAGGVPHVDKPDDHVRLGDIVVSNKRGVIQYDCKKLNEIRSCPVPPNARLIEAVRLLEAAELAGLRPWDQFIRVILNTLHWTRPGEATDILADSTAPTQFLSHPVDSKRASGTPRVFHGPIASANELLKDPGKRDWLRDNYSVKAVEMEGSGIADATWDRQRGYLVIRGICDYCDSYKNDVWHYYAAAAAAGYARALIESLPQIIPLPSFEVQRDGNMSIIASTGEAMFLPRNLPALPRDCGVNAVNQAREWKKIHSLAEQMFREFNELRTQMERYRRLGRKGDPWQVEHYLNEINDHKLPDFLRALEQLGGSLSENPCIQLLRKIQFCTPYIKSSVGSLPSCSDSHTGIVLVDRICSWLFDMLHRADQVLETYFGSLQSPPI